jgi:hypothetical protein
MVEENKPKRDRGDKGADGRSTSPRQIEANRGNAKNSTAARTPKGKRNSSLNAIKHGSRATQIVIPGREDPAEFEEIVGELCDDWAPEGHTEIVLVSEIAFAEWRLLRLRCVELASVVGHVNAH